MSSELNKINKRIHSIYDCADPLEYLSELSTLSARKEQLIHERYERAIAQVRPEHEQCMFDPKRYDVSYSKVGMCPFTRKVNKYSVAAGKVVTMLCACGKCMWCKHKRQNSLIFRIYNHMKMYQHCLFVTLTYDDDHYPCDEETCKRDAQLFYKRLRKKCDSKTLSYFHCCEKGRISGRLHHHCLLFWNCDIAPALMKKYVNDSWQFPQRCWTNFGELWSKLDQLLPSFAGFTYFGEVSNKSITYCTKYMNKSKEGLCVFQSWSKGLGLDILAVDHDVLDKMRYLNLFSYQPEPDSKRYYVTIPKYYKDKIFSESERDSLFRFYIETDDYKAKLRAVEDKEFMLHLRSLFNDYKRVALQREKAFEYQRSKRGTNL